ncbi:MAG: 2OG-Fe(II) oxygenase [Rhizomicrobium sp.]
MRSRRLDRGRSWLEDGRLRHIDRHREPPPPAGSAGAGSAWEIVPPYLTRTGFLDAAAADALLDRVIRREDDFRPSPVGRRGVDPTIRRSWCLRDHGALTDALKIRLLDLFPSLLEALHVAPFAAQAMEIEIVAHGDGAFYTRHVDTQVARYDELDHVRALSCVYYFHAMPKAFAGGNFRLHAIGGEAAGFVDIEPGHNSLLVLPAWAPHEVLPVHCPSGAFRDSRFAINCWFSRPKPESAA